MQVLKLEIYIQGRVAGASEVFGDPGQLQPRRNDDVKTILIVGAAHDAAKGGEADIGEGIGRAGSVVGKVLQIGPLEDAEGKSARNQRREQQRQGQKAR